MSQCAAMAQAGGARHAVCLCSLHKPARFSLTSRSRFGLDRLASPPWKVISTTDRPAPISGGGRGGRSWLASPARPPAPPPLWLCLSPPNLRSSIVPRQIRTHVRKQRTDVARHMREQRRGRRAPATFIPGEGARGSPGPDSGLNLPQTVPLREPPQPGRHAQASTVDTALVEP